MNYARLKSLVKEAVQEVLAEREVIRTNTDDEFLTVEEAAKFLRLSVATLYDNKRSNRGIPSYKTGKRLVYKKSDLIAWREARKVQHDTFDQISTEAMNYNIRKHLSKRF
jgi:excisionase family DNA binding protein